MANYSDGDFCRLDYSFSGDKTFISAPFLFYTEDGGLCTCRSEMTSSKVLSMMYEGVLSSALA